MTMANPHHLALLKRGASEWNKWRKGHPDVYPDLSNETLTKHKLAKYDLHDVDLLHTNLRASDLRGANLNGASLIAAELDGANLANAHLNNAFMLDVSLHHANLARAILRGASLNRSDLSEAKLRGADLTGADLFQARMVETDLRQAVLSGCRVYGASAWGVRLDGAIQIGLIITPRGKPTITVDDLEVAQFIYLLLNNKRIRNVIDAVDRKLVLILGRFTRARKAVLEAIREELRKRDYIPVLFDFNKPATRDFTETICTLAHLSRFIIADISSPRSVSQELQAITPDLAVAVQPILSSGQREYGMFRDLRRKHSWILPTYYYQDVEHLIASLDEKIFAPAEQKAKEWEKR